MTTEDVATLFVIVPLLLVPWAITAAVIINTLKTAWRNRG